MNDEQQVITVVLTRDLARRSLARANARGLSRSAWLRALIGAALEGETSCMTD